MVAPRRCEVTLMLLLLLSPATCQVKVEGFHGDDVLLPCIYRGTDPLPPRVSVFWRNQDDRHVLDIRDGKEDQSTQSPEFKGRVTSSSSRYGNGNFSAMMRSVKLTDSGKYVCDVRWNDFQQMVTLTVTGKRVVMTAAPPPPAGGAVVTQLSLLVAVFYSVALL